MKRTYFGYQYRLDSQNRHLIWFTEEVDYCDGVFVAPNGFVPTFVSRAELQRFAHDNDLSPLEFSEAETLDLDVLARWLRMKKMRSSRRVACVHFLNAWNLFGDISQSIGGDFDANQARTQKIYYKLFWGNNLPALTPPGHCYIPLWTGHELDILREVLSHGLQMFRIHTRLFR